MGNISLFDVMNEDSRRIIRQRLPVIKFFLDHASWVCKAISLALHKKDYYQTAFLAQQLLLSMSEGPIRWILWAALNKSKPITLAPLLTEVSKKRDIFNEGFLDALYGKSIHDAIRGDVIRIDELLSGFKKYSPEKAAKLISKSTSTKRFGLRELRNALAHQDFYIKKDGTLVWKKKDEWTELPFVYLIGFIGKTLSPVRIYLKELTDYLISFYKLEKPIKN